MSDMSRTEIIDVLLNEMECVQRASDDECNRDCAECDLLRDTDKILQAYKIAIKALEHPEENVVKIIPHGNLISRQAAIKAAMQDVNDKRTNGFIAGAMRAANRIKLLPSVNLQAKTGYWEKTTDEYCYWYKCSCCGTKAPKNEWGSDYFSPYCPECGAKIVEPQESEEEE